MKKKKKPEKKNAPLVAGFHVYSCYGEKNGSSKR